MEEFLNFLQREDVKEFIQQNRETDVQKILLNPPVEFKQYINYIADQIISRQKIKQKLPEWYQNSDLILPPPVSVEQASSVATCAYKKSLLDHKENHFVDLTGGLGADCLALSEGFPKATYVEAQKPLCQIFDHNSSVLSKDIKIINATAEEYLKSTDLSSNAFLYIDPDRRDRSKNKVFKIEDCSPNLIEVLSILDVTRPCMMVKYSPLLDITEVIRQVDHIKELHVVSVKNDCKELLLLIDSDFSGEPMIHCVNLESDQPDYCFSFATEKVNKAEFSEANAYLYEPNSSVLKAGAFQSIAVDFRLKKLAANTHLYTHPGLIPSFPGRAFEILESANKESVRKYAPHGKINVLVRNHPQTPEQIKKKWKLKDGGDFFLLGFRDFSNIPHMVIAKKC